MRLATEKRAVLAVEGHGLAALGGDYTVQILKVAGFDDAEHDAEKFAAGRPDSARDRDHPGSGDLVDDGGADKRAEIVVIAPIGVKVTIGSIDERGRPGAGERDNPSGAVDQRNRIGLRQTLQPFKKKAVNLLGGELPSKLPRVGHIGGAHHGLRFLQHHPPPGWCAPSVRREWWRGCAYR